MSKLGPSDAAVRNDAIDKTIILSRQMREIILHYARRNDRLELIILIITVLTSGGLWILIAKSFDSVAAWAGAVFSTVVAGLTAYQKGLGPKQQLTEALELQKKIDELLVTLRTSPQFDEAQYLRDYKLAAGAAIRLKYKGRDLSTLTPQERQEYEQSFGQ